jgi:hypothetical protein
LFGELTEPVGQTMVESRILSLGVGTEFEFLLGGKSMGNPMEVSVCGIQINQWWNSSVVLLLEEKSDRFGELQEEGEQVP